MELILNKVDISNLKRAFAQLSSAIVVAQSEDIFNMLPIFKTEVELLIKRIESLS